MKTSAVSGVSFKGRILDAHMHNVNDSVPYDNLKCGNRIFDSYIGAPLSVNVAGKQQEDVVVRGIVSSLDVIFDKADELEGNRKTLALCAENPKLAPMAVCKPGSTNGDTTAIRQVLSEGKGRFVGLKFHPSCLSLAADSPQYDNYMKLAAEKKLPCLFHCGKDGSAPEMIYSLAKRHPNVPVIFAHMGMEEAGNPEKVLGMLVDSVTKKNSKLYADISWVNWQNFLPSEQPTEVIHALGELKKKNGLDRVLFGTDAPLGCYGTQYMGDITPKRAYEMTVERMKTAIKTNFNGHSDEIIDNIFYKNAEQLFFNNNDSSLIGRIIARKPRIAIRLPKLQPHFTGRASIINAATAAISLLMR